MARKFSLLTSELLEEANREYVKLKEDNIAKKLLEIIACSEHSGDLSIILCLKKPYNTSTL